MRCFLEAAKAFLRNAVKIVRTKIFGSIGTTTVSATTKKFVSKKKFKLRKDGGVCSCLGENFEAWFLKGDGKIEEPVMEQELRYANLSQASVDSSIIKELGGEAKAETSLTEMFSMMEK